MPQAVYVVLHSVMWGLPRYEGAVYASAVKEISESSSTVAIAYFVLVISPQNIQRNVAGEAASGC